MIARFKGILWKFWLRFERVRMIVKLKKTFRKLCLQQSSLSDHSAYTAFCELASRDEEVFASFKRHPVYTPILEHVTEEQGSAYLEKILSDSPNLVEFFPKFRENDLYGNPHTYSYNSFGEFSPTTLRYIKVLGDLLRFFGDLSALNIVEIGIGYGGQCKIISDYCGLRSYTLIDLDSPLKLAKKYLNRYDLKENVYYRTMKDLTNNEDESYDLVISNYAFSECTRPVQEIYFEKVLSVSPKGYLICNVITPEYFESFTQE